MSIQYVVGDEYEYLEVVERQMNEVDEVFMPNICSWINFYSSFAQEKSISFQEIFI